MRGYRSSISLLITFLPDANVLTKPSSSEQHAWLVGLQGGWETSAITHTCKVLDRQQGNAQGRRMLFAQAQTGLIWCGIAQELCGNNQSLQGGIWAFSPVTPCSAMSETFLLPGQAGAPGGQRWSPWPALPSPMAVVWGAGPGERRAKIIQEPEGGGGGEMRREVRNSSSGKKNLEDKEFKISEGRKRLSRAHWGA